MGIKSKNEICLGCGHFKECHFEMQVFFTAPKESWHMPLLSKKPFCSLDCYHEWSRKSSIPIKPIETDSGDSFKPFTDHIGYTQFSPHATAEEYYEEREHKRNLYIKYPYQIYYP